MATGKHQLNAGRTDTVFQTQESPVSSFTFYKHMHTKKPPTKHHHQTKIKPWRRRANNNFCRNSQAVEQDADHTSQAQRAFEHTKKPWPTYSDFGEAMSLPNCKALISSQHNRLYHCLQQKLFLLCISQMWTVKDLLFKL